MDDSISRHAAINVASNDQLIIDAMDSVEDGDMNRTKRAIQRLLESLPSEQPKQRWIPCNELFPVTKCLACDKFGQVVIVSSVVCINGVYYDAENFEFNKDLFLKGKMVGKNLRIIPREIIAWMPLPEPYKEEH